MITAWTKHISDEKQKEQFKNEILGSKRVLERLSVLVDQLDYGLAEEEISPKAYDNPNWAYRQAHANGVKAALRKIKTLLDLDQG